MFHKKLNYLKTNWNDTSIIGLMFVVVLQRNRNEYFGDSHSFYRAKIVDDSTIILVFEGINLFRDPDTKEEANVGLWLPK